MNNKNKKEVLKELKDRVISTIVIMDKKMDKIKDDNALFLKDVFNETQLSEHARSSIYTNNKNFTLLTGVKFYLEGIRVTVKKAGKEIEKDEELDIFSEKVLQKLHEVGVIVDEMEEIEDAGV